MDKKNLIILILIGIIIFGSLLYVHARLTNKAYQQGIQDTTILINQRILNSLQQNNYVPFVYNFENQIYNIKLVPQIP